MKSSIIEIGVFELACSKGSNGPTPKRDNPITINKGL